MSASLAENMENLCRGSAWINRGYYMGAWGYEFYVLALKVSLTSERKRPCNVLFIL